MLTNEINTEALKKRQGARNVTKAVHLDATAPSWSIKEPMIARRTKFKSIMARIVDSNKDFHSKNQHLSKY